MTQLVAARPDTPGMSAHHSALRCLFLVAMHHRHRLTPEQLATADPADTLASVRRLLRRSGFSSQVLTRRRWKDVTALGKAYPAIAVGRSGHWVIVIGTIEQGETRAVVVLDPAVDQAAPAVLSEAEFAALWNGTLILCRRQARLLDPDQPFGLRWFLPEIARQRRCLRDVAIAAFASTVISLATPLLYRVIIDKVIPHKSYQTLGVVVAVFLLITVFDGLFVYVRQRMMLFATNKIDARLASQTFQRLLRLPMPFFEHMTAGVLARHMQQTEKLRQFLTGRLFQTLLDAAALPLLLVLLAFYSGKLTIIVFGFALAIAGVIALLIPTFRQRLSQLYQTEGGRQAHLVETIHGMRTVKSLAIEPQRQEEWDGRVAVAVRSQAGVARIAMVANGLTGGLDKLMQMSVLGLGAVDVFDGGMSLGALIAFTMLSGRVSGPLIQIVGLINEYQETALSVRMLGAVMDHPPERDPRAEGIRPPITGRLAFERVTFRYAGSSTPALDRVSFAVEPGEVLGIVGRSGSGKTTVTRMIQGIQTAQEGAIRLGDIDIRHIDLAHLRREVGVVLQDSFLFRGSIRDNIAATRPDAALDAIVAAARLAGAEEFIERLPLAYDTVIEEGAANLSGGQRQRLAIARALLPQPPLLIFDEATSALDPESEAILQANLAEIARHRTMVIVSHRLASLVHADNILVLDQGQVADCAPHPVLLDRCAIYRHLWQQQTRHMFA